MAREKDHDIKDRVTNAINPILDKLEAEHTGQTIPRPRWITDSKPDGFIQTLSQLIMDLCLPNMGAESKKQFKPHLDDKISRALQPQAEEQEQPTPSPTTDNKSQSPSDRLDVNSQQFELYDTLTFNIFTLLRNSLPGLFLQAMREQNVIDNLTSPDDTQIESAIEIIRGNPASPLDTQAELKAQGGEKNKRNEAARDAAEDAYVASITKSGP